MKRHTTRQTIHPFGLMGSYRHRSGNYGLTVIGIDPNRRQFHFLCWISKTIPGVSLLESHNKIVSKIILPLAEWNRLGTVVVSATGRVRDEPGRSVLLLNRKSDSSMETWSAANKTLPHHRDRSLSTPVSFSMLDFLKKTLSFISRIT